MNTIYIIGLANQERTRRMFEDEFVRQLAAFDVTGMPSYLSIPGREDIDEDKIAMKSAASGADAILMAHVTGSRIEEVVDPGHVTPVNRASSHHWGQNRHRHYRSYFNRHRDIIFEPATIRQFEIAIVEASLYLADTGELVWSAQLETVLERDMRSLLTDFVRAVVRDMDNNNLL